jgi:hypothetical protein
LLVSACALSSQCCSSMTHVLNGWCHEPHTIEATTGQGVEVRAPVRETTPRVHRHPITPSDHTAHSPVARVAVHCPRRHRFPKVPSIVKWIVVLRRSNGRLVKKSRPFRSKYAAKQFRKRWDKKYDLSYYTEIEPA